MRYGRLLLSMCVLPGKKLTVAEFYILISIYLCEKIKKEERKQNKYAKLIDNQVDNLAAM